MIKNFIGHFKTISNHKLIVMKYCFKVGLYKQGLLHDMSKYSWTEFSTGVKYYTGHSSPNGLEKREVGYSTAWLHHKGRNKHHFEYWMDYDLDASKGIVGANMPTKYVVEMFIDRMAACKNYLKDKYHDNSPLKYYERGKEDYIMHKDSRELLELLLNKLASEGENNTINYIKKVILKK
ncbi:hypothetical protein SAMN02745248_01656 [Hathewaya proteolytica DSM 3090]|uniref:Catalase n=1 Tax=Hathewaya proteolytica DSM 3090 TaxID=1121331 RepID=A0A1M6PAP8_9CLOT|nr:DUF5662 family protein [Hathewaya proteolytica]SHK04940.1 hypothetical protein SAMN02745248_01656 [Hathewaya proteolytica DSM 3090]